MTDTDRTELLAMIARQLEAHGVTGDDAIIAAARNIATAAYEVGYARAEIDIAVAAKEASS